MKRAFYCFRIISDWFLINLVNKVNSEVMTGICRPFCPHGPDPGMKIGGWGGNSIENRDSEIFRDPDLLFSGRRWRIPIPPNTLSKYWSQRLNKHDIAKHKTDLEPVQMDICTGWSDALPFILNNFSDYFCKLLSSQHIKTKLNLWEEKNPWV